jgi:hypothetical protein
VARWNDFCNSDPEFAARVEELFNAGRHKTIATIRRDGSPRISGIECEFVDGDLRFASMLDARKLADLKRDPRFALHGPTFHPQVGDESAWPGEVKVAGTVRVNGSVHAEDDVDPQGEQFVVDVTEVVFTHLNSEATKLVIEWWTPNGGHRRVERE